MNFSPKRALRRTVFWQTHKAKCKAPTAMPSYSVLPSRRASKTCATLSANIAPVCAGTSKTNCANSKRVDPILLLALRHRLRKPLRPLFLWQRQPLLDPRRRFPARRHRLPHPCKPRRLVRPQERVFHLPHQRHSRRLQRLGRSARHRQLPCRLLIKTDQFTLDLMISKTALSSTHAVPLTGTSSA